MYVARMHLNLGTRRAAPGEAVPEAERWEYPVLQAHLRLGWIEKVEEVPPSRSTAPSEITPIKKKTPKKKQIA